VLKNSSPFHIGMHQASSGDAVLSGGNSSTRTCCSAEYPVFLTFDSHQRSVPHHSPISQVEVAEQKKAPADDCLCPT